MQPHDEQHQEQQPGQSAASPYTDVPKQASHPVVTLSPDEDQDVRTVYPVTDSAEAAPPTKGAAYDQPVRWQATEYIHRERDQLWFILFVAATLVLIIAAIFLIKSITFAVLIPVMAAALIVYTRRPPRILDYTLSRQGLHINDHLYPFAEFKGFALVHGGEEYSIMLIPVKRFKPAVSVYFPEEAGEAIVDMLAARLPMGESHLDVVDRLVQKLHL
jgi:hypothetical protein